MNDLKVSRFKAFVIYYAVSYFGGRAWANNAKLKACGEGRILLKIPTENVKYAQWKSAPGVFMDGNTGDGQVRASDRE